ncbi:MAG: phosphoribosylanthranilate isomerase [Lachnospiraceae bacterium]|nr:phosphoribosylanthranilate isomerase [Lachnospiraceae bacterium]
MVRVKICGLKTLADVEKVNRYLPEYIGFVFANTKRFVTDEQALCMRQALDRRIQAVGVFVNEPMEHVIDLCDRGVIDVVQLHGEESEAYIREFKQKTDTIVIKAVKVQNAEQVSKQMSQEADYMLFDTYKKGEPGGTGERFPLEILEECLRELRVKGQTIKPCFLAGGLDCQNVTEVLGQVERNVFRECIAVDVSTGVETDGTKDEEKIRQFIEYVRNAGIRKGDL